MFEEGDEVNKQLIVNIISKDQNDVNAIVKTI